MRNTAEPSVEAIHAEAADWCIRLHDCACTAAERQAFTQWLAQSPQHAEAFEQLREIWSLSAQLDSLPERSRWAEAEGLPLKAQHRPRPSKKRWGWAAALCFLTLPTMGYAGWLMGWVPTEYEYHRADDQPRQVQLPDGTWVELNLYSQLRFLRYRDRRSLSVEGEGYFRIQAEPASPVVLQVGAAQVRTLGAELNLWQGSERVAVSVLEGSVQIDLKTQYQPYHLSAPMQLSYQEGQKSPVLDRPQLETVLAWRQGKLVLDDLPLAEALVRMNRYLKESVQFEPAALTGLRLGGVYDTQHIPAFVQKLPQVLPVQLSQTTQGELWVKAKP